MKMIVLAPLFAAALLAGCHGAHPAAAPGEVGDLRRRSLDLLLRAAESEFDDVAAHAMEALVDQAPRDGAVIFRRALSSSRPLLRYAGLVSLGRLAKRDALPAILTCADDRHPQVRLAAAFAALRCGGSTQRFGPVLVNALRDQPTAALRADAAYLIGLLGERRAAARLRYAAQHEKSSRVLVQIEGALAMLGDDDAFRSLIAYTQGDQAARAIALQTLIELKDRRARNALLDRLADADNEYVVIRLLAARGLGQLGDATGFDFALSMADDSTPIPK